MSDFIDGKWWCIGCNREYAANLKPEVCVGPGCKCDRFRWVAGEELAEAREQVRRQREGIFS
jgi:hypothetical protein